MSQETTVLDQELELDNSRANSDALLSGERKSFAAPVKSDAQAASSSRSFSERMKEVFSNFAKNLEGDQEHHKYRS